MRRSRATRLRRTARRRLTIHSRSRCTAPIDQCSRLSARRRRLDTRCRWPPHAWREAPRVHAADGRQRRQRRRAAAAGRPACPRHYAWRFGSSSSAHFYRRRERSRSASTRCSLESRATCRSRILRRCSTRSCPAARWTTPVSTRQKLDAAFDRVRAARTHDALIGAWRDVQRTLADETPVAWVYHSRGVQGVTSRLSGVRMDLRGEMPTIADWRLAGSHAGQ